MEEVVCKTGYIIHSRQFAVGMLDVEEVIATTVPYIFTDLAGVTGMLSEIQEAYAEVWEDVEVGELLAKEDFMEIEKCVDTLSQVPIDDACVGVKTFRVQDDKGLEFVDLFAVYEYQIV